MKDHRRRFRSFFALLLAAMLAAEPVGTLPAVCAAEGSAEIMTMQEAEIDTPGHEWANEAKGPENAEAETSGETNPAAPASDGAEDPETPDPGSTEDGDNSNTEPETPANGEAQPGTGFGDSGNEEGGEPDSGDTEEKEDAGSGDTGQKDGGREETGGSDTEEEDKTEGDEPDDEEEAAGDKSADSEEDAEDGEDPVDTEEESSEDGEKIEKILDSFTEMSSGYHLTSEQMQSKQDLAAHLDEISDYQEGVDYVKGQIVTFAETEEEAELIAAAYNAELVQFEYGILTLQLHGEDAVNKAMRAAASEKINLPAVWPNYYRYASGEIVEEPIAEPVDLPEDIQNDMASEAPAPENYEDDYIEIETQEYDAEENEESVDTDGSEEPETPADEYLEALGYTDPYLQSTNYYYQYHHTTIGSAYAWSAGSTGRGIRVAVLDTGVTNQTEVSATSIYGKGNSDSQGHGTHVAGIIGAKANGSMGVGVAPDVTLYSGNVLPNGSGTDADIMSAIRAAQRKNVDIINMSLGGIGYNGSFQTVVDGAYTQGIAIFAASGNDGGMNYNYPACYDHVISVAATNSGNGRAYFSNYGNKVDLSAPGVDIWSTGKNGGNYVSMSGTSMACPVAAGEAAVILSGNADIRNKTGKARVDALESLMKSNTLKVGSDMGSGITILPKVLKLSTAAVKPAAPDIRLTPDSASAAQSVRVTIKAPDNVKVYYTTNGQNPVFKNGQLGNGAVRYSQQFTVNNQAKATIKAIAVNESGVSSVVRSVAYTLKPYVNRIAISGVQQVAQGKNIQLKAEVQPAYAANKKVTWELYTTDGRKIDSKTDAALAREVGVSISSGGKVTASGKAKTGNYNVRVTSKDARGRSATYRITVIDSVKIDSVKLTTTKLSLTLPGEKTYDLSACLEGKCKDGTPAAVSDFKWSSSNAAVARVSTSGAVMAVRPGKATITALANDSSGRKATCTVTVVQQITYLTVSDNNKVAVGKSQIYKATILPSNASNKKVKWTLLYGSEEVTAKRAKELGVSINASSGKLTTTTKAATGSYTVKATASDGSGISGSRVIKVVRGSITGITFTDKAYSKVSLFRKKQVYNTQTSAVIYAQIKGTEDADTAAYEVTSSNPDIATATAKRISRPPSRETAAAPSEGENRWLEVTVSATGTAAGRSTVTIRATDGSNKKAACTVTVRNPVSGIRIAPSGGNTQFMSRGKTLQLKAIVETENGAVSNKGVKWEVRGGTGVSISSGGRLKAARNASTGYCYVYATAKDGSGVTASYQIGVVEPTTWIRLYSSGGYLSTKKKILLRTGGRYALRVDSDSMLNGYTVSSSNPAVVSGTFSSNNVLMIVGSKKGSATITVSALDGSGKKVKYRFKVR